MDKKGEPSIYCDGACSGNGTKKSVGGWAWAYWPGEARGNPTRYAADKLKVTAQMPATNQRAELTALLEALKWCSGYGMRSLTIYTDSMYALNCASKWGPSWKRKGWKRDSGEPLQNLDLIKPLVELWKPVWRLEHVRGHQTGYSPQVIGNNWVDKAAVEAAQGLALSETDYVPINEHDVIAVSLTPGDMVIEHVDSSAPPSPEATLPPVKKLIKNEIKNPIKKPVVKQADIRSWFGV
jgi:ribonuclease HI